MVLDLEDVALNYRWSLQDHGLHLLQPEAEVTDLEGLQRGGDHPRACGVGCPLPLVLLFSRHLQQTGVVSALVPIRRPSAAVFLV